MWVATQLFQSRQHARGLLGITLVSTCAPPGWVSILAPSSQLLPSLGCHGPGWFSKGAESTGGAEERHRTWKGVTSPLVRPPQGVDTEQAKVGFRGPGARDVDSVHIRGTEGQGHSGQEAEMAPGGRQSTAHRLQPTPCSNPQVGCCLPSREGCTPCPVLSLPETTSDIPRSKSILRPTSRSV